MKEIETEGTISSVINELKGDVNSRFCNIERERWFRGQPDYYEHKLEPWDSAAGYLIVEEAGGKVTDHEGKKFSPYQHRILATNGKIHDELLLVIKNEKEL